MKVSLHHVCLIVGVLHLVLIALRLYERIWELVILQEPVLMQDHMSIITSYLVQIFTISLLIYGSTADRPNFTIPWLLVTTPAFVIGTLYAISVIFKEELLQIFYNFLTLSAVWTTWCMVIKFNIHHNEILRNCLRRPPSGYTKVNNGLLM